MRLKGLFHLLCLHHKTKSESKESYLNKRQARIINETRVLNNFSKKMVRDGQQKLFKYEDRFERSKTSRDKPVSLYYALSIDKSSESKCVSVNNKIYILTDYQKRAENVKDCA
jgi:hypothetical protein